MGDGEVHVWVDYSTLDLWMEASASGYIPGRAVCRQMRRMNMWMSHQRDQRWMDGQKRRFGVEDARWMMEVHCGKLHGGLDEVWTLDVCVCVYIVCGWNTQSKQEAIPNPESQESPVAQALASVSSPRSNRASPLLRRNSTLPQLSNISAQKYVYLHQPSTTPNSKPRPSSRPDFSVLPHPLCFSSFTTVLFLKKKK